ncbi:hypothetical protein JCM10296v2_003381 [Rhodotorula toruloides]
MTSLEDFDRQVKALVTKGKLSSSAVDGVTKAAMANVGADSHLVSTLYRHHKKATPSHKLTSLYLIDAVAREARSRQKKADKEGKGKDRAAPAPAGSTTPSGSPPPDDGAGAGASGDGTFATFLKKLEAVLGKIVLDNWENGLPEHKEKVRKVLDIWTKASTFSSSTIAKISSKLLATASTSAAPAPPRAASPGRPSLSPGPVSPPRDSTPSTSSGIPANVLALLQASTQAAPSRAALEQKKQEEMESEIERVLREAKEGSSSAAYSAPPPAQPQPAPYGSNYPSASSSSAYSTPSYPQPPPSAYPLPSSSTPVHPSHQYASGYGSSSQHPPPPPPSHAQPPYQASSYPQQYQQPPQQYPPPQHQQHASYPSQHQPSSYPPPQQQQPQKRTRWDDSTSHASNGDGGYQSRPAEYNRQHPPPRSYSTYGDERSYGDSYGRREEPPAKKPYQPPAERAPQPEPSLPTRPPVPSRPDAPGESYSAPSSTTPQPSSASTAPLPSAPPNPVPAPAQTLVAPPPPPPFDPTTFDATSPDSWTAFVGVLRAAHPYFASLGRMPYTEEVMSLCMPAAMMAFGTPGASVGMMVPIGGMGGMQGMHGMGAAGEQGDEAAGGGGEGGGEYSGNDGQAY